MFNFASENADDIPKCALTSRFRTPGAVFRSV